jgi:hypothetical protein
MKKSTWRALDDLYAKFPSLQAGGAPQREIDAAGVELGVVLPEEYQDFLRRYGGGIVGSLEATDSPVW